jgi:RHS repeat-associated protein
LEGMVVEATKGQLKCQSTPELHAQLAFRYFYDAEGRRLEKSTNGVRSEDYFYGRDGNVMIQTNVPTFIETYVGGMHLSTEVLNAAHNGTNLYFHHADWLGTERARTDMTGTACETIGSLPFGDGQVINGTCGDVSQRHLTGKERDSESTLDNFGARYYGSNMGRFLQSDPVVVTPERFYDPQQLNLYAYGTTRSG